MVTGLMRVPRKPRRTSPRVASCSTTWLAMLEGMAKPIPTEPPEGEKIAVFTPTTRPSMENEGPPELPRLIDASVWMKLS